MHRRPNVVVVLVDQLRSHALGFAGDPNVRTPNLDRMAREGVVFTGACSSFPACVPFRFSLMTGEYAHSRNVPGLAYRLSPAERTLGEAVGALGHATAYIGKWHLYSSYGVTGGLTLSQANRTPIPRTHRRGFDHWRGFELRNDFYDTWYFADDETEPRRVEGYQTDGLFDLAIDYVERRRPSERPFFLVLSIEAPHPPFMAPDAALDRVLARGPIRHRPNVDVRAIRFFPPEWYEKTNRAGAIDPADPQSVHRVFDANMAAYYAMVETIDDNMARLDAALQRAGVAEDTVTVFLSDHGELGGSHGFLGKAEPYEESIGIPLIVHSRGRDRVARGLRIDTPVGTEDLFFTLVGLAGGNEPAPSPRLDFAPAVRGSAPVPERDGVLLEFVAEYRPSRSYHDRTWRGIRTRRHKYTVIGDRTGATPWQLFDLAADPFEMRNLVADPKAAVVARDLHGRLARLLDESDDDYALSPAFGHPARSAVAI